MSSGMTRQLKVLDDDPGTLLKVAFASSDRSTVNEHFGSSPAFVIYGIDPERRQLLSVAEFGELAQDGNEDKLAAKLKLLSGCIAVYCCACGASAMRQLLAVGVQPVKVEMAPIDGLLDALQTELREGPSSWLAKAIRQQSGAGRDNQRFDAMMAEGWEE